MEERLQKILAERGVASRRAAEKIILEGRVTVNGLVVDTLGSKADPEKDAITVDGKELPQQSDKPVYILLFKPSGYITSVGDPRKRRTVLDLLPVKERVYPVGRLDYATSGCLLITNDGDLTNGLLHPKGEVPKTYECAIKGEVSNAQIQMLEKGIRLRDGITAPAKASIKKKVGDITIVNITIHEGRNRQVRRMMAALGLDVAWLCRRGFAGLDVKNMKPGEWRYLTEQEVKALENKAGIHRK